MSDPKPVHATPGVLRRVSACAGVVLAPNPGPMTLDGTNTWILSAPGDGPEHPNYGHHPSAQGRGEWPGPDVVVVDPGDTRSVMTRAVDQARRLARPGDTVLLAPAHASMDQFASYAERGDAFAAAARALGDRLAWSIGTGTRG